MVGAAGSAMGDAEVVAVMGVDACRGRWVAVLLTDDRRWMAAHVDRRIADAYAYLVAVARQEQDEIRVIAVDIPIGLPDTGRRPVDAAAKKALRARSSAVFITPTRA